MHSPPFELSVTRRAANGKENKWRNEDDLKERTLCRAAASASAVGADWRWNLYDERDVLRAGVAHDF